MIKIKTISVMVIILLALFLTGCVKKSVENHPPEILSSYPEDNSCIGDSEVTLYALIEDPDGDKMDIRMFWRYQDILSDTPWIEVLNTKGYSGSYISKPLDLSGNYYPITYNLDWRLTIFDGVNVIDEIYSFKSVIFPTRTP